MTKEKKILLIEDDAFISELYETVFEKEGYEIDAVRDGEEALEVVGNKHYDLILLDIMLPKLTGIEVLRRLKSPDSGVSDIPVYLLTNLGEENVTKEAFKLGAAGYLLKAKYLPKQLVSEIDSFFASRKADAESGIL